MNKAEIELLEVWQKQGAQDRDDLAICPYAAGTIAHYMHALGWLRRDLQLALCVARPAYGKSQLAAGNITVAQLEGR